MTAVRPRPSHDHVSGPRVSGRTTLPLGRRRRLARPTPLRRGAGFASHRGPSAHQRTACSRVSIAAAAWPPRSSASALVRTICRSARCGTDRRGRCAAGPGVQDRGIRRPVSPGGDVVYVVADHHEHTARSHPLRHPRDGCRAVRHVQVARDDQIDGCRGAPTRAHRRGPRSRHPRPGAPRPARAPPRRSRRRCTSTRGPRATPRCVRRRSRRRSRSPAGAPP